MIPGVSVLFGDLSFLRNTINKIFHTFILYFSTGHSITSRTQKHPYSSHSCLCPPNHRHNTLQTKFSHTPSSYEDQSILFQTNATLTTLSSIVLIFLAPAERTAQAQDQLFSLKLYEPFVINHSTSRHLSESCQ